MSEPATRYSLLVRLCDPSQHEAWQEFIDIYEPLIYRLARQKGFQHADALDLVQEVFVVVGKAIDRFEPDPAKGSFRGWLFRITRNLMINFISRSKGSTCSGDSQIQHLLNQQAVLDARRLRNSPWSISASYFVGRPSGCGAISRRRRGAPFG